MQLRLCPRFTVADMPEPDRLIVLSQPNASWTVEMVDDPRSTRTTLNEPVDM
jgi:hypothetical protein